MDASFKNGKLPKSPLGHYQVTSTPTTETTPSFFSKEVLISSFHHAASLGERKQVKKILKKGVPIDACSATGQTALFLACHNGHQNVVEILLANGANPNVRCCDEATAMHAASFSGNINTMLMLIEAGGDLRLHDKHNRSVAEWAVFNHDEKKQKKMVQFLKKAQSLAVSTTSTGTIKSEKSFAATLRPETTRGSLFKKKSEPPSQGKSNLWQTGFGKMCGDGQNLGLLGLIPLVPENQLRHDDFGLTYNNGPFMVMESMQWIHTAVTVKRLHKDPPPGGKVDLLINECETISRLRHPHLLLMMGVCQTNYMESLVLLYERIGCGSLFTYLYQKNENIEVMSRCDIVRQVCEAVIFLHHQHLLHTAITSHAVQLITPSHAKLANLEYMVPIGSDGSAPHTSAVNNHYPNAVYNWMAPELMAGEPPQTKSDLYSVCSLLWELMECMPPMSGLPVSGIRERLLGKRTRVFVRQQCGEPYRTMLHYGLALQPRNRLVTLEWMRDALTQVITEKESSLIRSGEMQHRHSRYIPRYQNSQHDVTTTDEESDTVTDGTVTDASLRSGSVRSAASHRNHKLLSQPLNSTVASSTLVDISEQYSLGDIEGVMLSPQTDAPTPKIMNKDPSTSTLKATPSSSSGHYSRSTFLPKASTSSMGSEGSAGGNSKRQNETSLSFKTATPTAQKQTEEAQHSDSVSQASGDSFHTVLEMPVAAMVAPPREESFKFLGGLEAATPAEPAQPIQPTPVQPTPEQRASIQPTPSSSSQDTAAKKNTAASSRKKFFRSMRRRSSGSSISSTEGSARSKASSKSSKLSLLKSVMRKRSSSQQRDNAHGDTMDISAIPKPDTTNTTLREPTPPPVLSPKPNTPPHTDKEEKASERSSEQNSPTNPFKKYTDMEINTDDILSEEVKAILARPRKILKLPSFYEKRPPPRTVTGTLLYQYSGNVAFPQPHASPQSPTHTEEEGQADITPREHVSTEHASPPAVSVRRRSSTTIVPSTQASWVERSLIGNLSLPVAAELCKVKSTTPPLTESCPKLSTTAPEAGTLEADTVDHPTVTHDREDYKRQDYNSGNYKRDYDTGNYRREDYDSGSYKREEYSSGGYKFQISTREINTRETRHREMNTRENATNTAPRYTDPSMEHGTGDYSDYTLTDTINGENSSYKPASRLLPSPSPRRVTPEPVRYHVPSPSPSPRKRLTEEGGPSPSPIAPVRCGKTLQRSSTTLPARASLRLTGTLNGSIKEEWLQAYAGAAVPPGMTQDPFLKYRAARRVSNRYRSILHEAMSEQNTAPTHTQQTQNTSYRDVGARSVSYHSSPSVLRQRTGAQGVIDFSSKGPIKNIIASFQGKLEEHLQKQAILQLRRKPQSDSKKDTFTSETFHTPSKAQELKVPQCGDEQLKVTHSGEDKQRMSQQQLLRALRCTEEQAKIPPQYSDEQLQLTLEGGPSYRVITPGTTVSTANITLQKTVPLQKPVPSPRTSHKHAFAESLKQIEAQADKDAQSSVTSTTTTPRNVATTGDGDSDDDSTGSDLSEYIGHVLSSCHQSVVELYKHPSCEHTPTATTAAAIASPAEKHSHHSHYSHYSHKCDSDNGGSLHRSPACTTRAGLLHKSNDNSNNSTTSSTRCASDTGLSASTRRSESEMSARSEGSRQRSIEEFYFDDELQPGVKSRYLSFEASSYGTSTDAELESVLQGDGLEFGKTPPTRTPVTEDYDASPYRTLDITDYKKFKQERKITRLTEDESGNSEDLIVTV